MYIANVNSHSLKKKPSRRKLRTNIRREQISQAALRLIGKRGLNELNIAALAREVGVVPSAIYRHYQHKDAMLESVLDLISKILMENVKAVRDETHDPFKRLHLLLQRHVRLVRHHAGIPRVIFSEQIFAGNAQRRRRIHKTISGYLQEIARIIAEGQKAGDIRAEVSVDSAAVMFLGIVQPAIILWIMSNHTFDVAGHAERAWGLFREMLETKRSFQISDDFNQTKKSK